MINWNITKADADKIHAIATRAMPGKKYPHFTDLTMDLTACHLNGCPLDLNGLLVASDADFCHDINGIWNHLDRETGKLTDCFVPRYAAKYAVTTV